MGSSIVGEASGSRVYAVGDIHGCSDETAVLLKHLEQEEGLNDDDTIIFLGDYIDRGPDTKGVVDILLDFKVRFPKARFLKGNHEDMLLDFLGFGGRLGQAFLYNGGLETVQSYGISVFASPEEMVGAFPQPHFKFFCDLESIIRAGRFAFVHAGLNPLRDLYTQNDNDVFWIRDEFIVNIHPFEHTVIFGHTPHQEIVLDLPFKIGIDTGLVFGNKLSCIEVRSGKVIQVNRKKDSATVDMLDLSKAFGNILVEAA